MRALVITTSSVDGRRRSLAWSFFFFAWTKKVLSLEESTENPKFHPISQKEGVIRKSAHHQLNTYLVSFI